jgi:hypothetical protein
LAKHLGESGLYLSISSGLVLSALQDGMDIYTIIFATLAVFIVLRLLSLLGRRTFFASNRVVVRHRGDTLGNATSRAALDVQASGRLGQSKCL